MDESPNGGSATGLSRGRRMLVLAICCLSLLIVGLDTTIVNVALPAIRSSLRASVSGLQWTIDAYTPAERFGESEPPSVAVPRSRYEQRELAAR